MADENEVSIGTICGGGVPEVFQRELYEVLKNINDPNTAAEKTRTITLKFTFKPAEDHVALAGVCGGGSGGVSGVLGPVQGLLGGMPGHGE